MKQTSSRTTGDEPVEGVDPGGTRPTKPGQADKHSPEPKPGETKIEQHVESGDRNTRPPRP